MSDLARRSRTCAPTTARSRRCTASTFALAEGSVTTLLGANGAGKTTTLRAICGMVRSTGEIEFDGHSLIGLSTEDIVKLGIAHVPQGRGTFTRMNVEENLQLGAITRPDRGAIASDIERMYACFRC